jgi:acetyl-CoA synthetase
MTTGREPGSASARSDQGADIDAVAAARPGGPEGAEPISSERRPDSGSPTASGAKRPAVPAGLVFDDPLDRPSADDTDAGWSEPGSGPGDDDFTRFLNEKPPHHL